MDTEVALSEVHRAYTILQDVVSTLRPTEHDSLFGTQDRRILKAAAAAMGELSELEEEV